MPRLIAILIFSTLALNGCGGGGGSSPSTSATVEPLAIADSAAERTLHGAAVKGPLLFATVTAYRLDTNHNAFFDSAAPIATGHTDGHAAINNVAIPAHEPAPLILVVDGSHSTDVNTGMKPVLETLITVVSDAQLNGNAVYPTSLTTLAFYIARLRAGPGASVDEFLAAHTEAVALITDTFPALDSDGVDILSDPPLLTATTVSTAQQQRVLTHRVIAEGVASLAFDTAAQHPSSAETLSADAALELFAQDLASDGVLDGLAGDTSIAAMAPELFSRTLTDVTLPNTNARLEHSVALLTQDLSYTGTSIIVQSADLRIDGSQSLGVQRTRTVASDGPTAPSWVLRWNPSNDHIVGYIVYFGNTPATATRRLATVALATLANPSAPSVSFMTTSELNLSPGMRGCFRLKAYNEAGRSGFSEAVCAVMQRR